MRDSFKKNYVPQNPPVFIVGYRRSGTTLLRNILHSHPEMAIVSESHFIAYFYDNIELYGNLNDDKNLVMLANDIISTKRYKSRDVNTIIDDAFIDRVHPRDLGTLLKVLYEEYCAKFSKPRWGDKTPYFLYEIPMLLELFPSCKIIHLVRDPRAAISSQIKTFSEYNVYENTKKWVKGILQFNHLKSTMLVDKYFETKYEDLVHDPETILKAICNFVELAYDKRMINYNNIIDDDVKHAKSALHLKSISSRHINIWKKDLSAKEIFRIEAIAGQLIKAYGYELLNGDCTEFSEPILQRKMYETICYFKTRKNPYNFSISIKKFIYKYLSRIGVLLIHLNILKVIGLCLLRFRIRFGVFDNPRKN